MPAYDTIVAVSPPITIAVRDIMLNFCKINESIDYCTGEIFYKFYTGALDGSYDYRIRLSVDNRHWVKPEGMLTPVALEGDWYIRIECSLHKLLMNHNCFGGPQDAKKAFSYLINFMNETIGISLPNYKHWEVERIDIAKIFVFQNSDICSRIINNLKNGIYSRRKPQAYSTGVMFAGSTTVDKFYWKGPEYKEHDYKRFMKYIAREIDVNWGKDNYDLVEQKLINLKMQAEKVLERAMRTIRFEVEIKNRKLKDMFNAEKVTVEMLKDTVLQKLLESELRKCIKEDENMEIVRRSDLVEEKLNEMYNFKTAEVLYSCWAKMVQFGEQHVKNNLKKATFYKYKKQLFEAGVSWSCCNINLKQIGLVPDDFTFLSDRYVDESVSKEVTYKLEAVA